VNANANARETARVRARRRREAMFDPPLRPRASPRRSDEPADLRVTCAKWPRFPGDAVSAADRARSGVARLPATDGMRDG
jgi:hypothetical protein